MGERRGVHRVLVRKLEGKRPLERPRRRWEDNIKMNLREVGGGGNWMELAQDRDRWRAFVNEVMNPMKLVLLMKMCLNIIYCRVRVG